VEQFLEPLLSVLASNWRTLLATLTFGFTAYFAWQKFFHKITISYQVSAGNYADEQITKFVISNRQR